MPKRWSGSGLRAELDQKTGSARLFYRHRHRNIGRKSGNIQDFCENWGAHYDYIVVLDADSLMQGECLGRLVRLMDANPRTALIQVPPQLVGRQSLFARIQQFASSVYGPVYGAGLAFLQGPDGNYWGHNAIIRVRAFMAHCGLPNLPGKPPFGGEIMSHDFVEAAFLARAGWQVWMAPESGRLVRGTAADGAGFSQARPPLVPGQSATFAHRVRARPENAQPPASGDGDHGLCVLASVAAASDCFRRQSRHLVRIGRRSVSSAEIPRWRWRYRMPAQLLQLAGATLVLLYGPKLVAMLVLLRDRALLRAHGGGRAVLRSVALESLFSTLFAPVVMLAHSWFVLTIALGIATGWGAQQRQDRTLSLLAVARQFWPHTLAGIGASVLLYRLAPESIGWFVPLLAGLLLAIPLVAITGSVLLGRAAAKNRLFLVPSETQPLPVLTGTHRMAMARATPAARDFPQPVLADRAVRALHLQLLHEAPPANDVAPERLAAWRRRQSRAAPKAFTRQDWIALLSDAESLIAAQA